MAVEQGAECMYVMADEADVYIMLLHYYNQKELNMPICSDRILTCRIKSICSPAKGGTGCYRFNYQPGS